MMMRPAFITLEPDREGLEASNNLVLEKPDIDKALDIMKKYNLNSQINRVIEFYREHHIDNF